MADATLHARSPLDAAVPPGRHGATGAEAGVTLGEVSVAGAASVAARSGRGEQVRLDLGLPPPGRWADCELGRAVWLGPDRWLVLADGDIERQLRERVGDAVAVTDQSDARCVIRVGGPRARDALAKAVPLDLHPRAFRPGNAATTLAAHLTIQIWQLDDAPSYNLAVARGYAADFAAFLLHAAAEFGVEMLSPR